MKYRSLDIRINQLIGFIGLDLAYNFYGASYKHGIFYSVGIYSGYAFKINNHPWIYSKQNRLHSDKTIEYRNYNIGLYFIINVE
ncbi:MAG: hypothetical protein Q8M08_10240 [Bacteroidales bacterium]|nr:hypothetical protein [Bacteroidales bacterium]